MRAKKETKKRMDKIKGFLVDIYNNSRTVFLVGSLSYSYNYDIKPGSDVDLIIIADKEQITNKASKMGISEFNMKYHPDIIRFPHEDKEFDIALHTMTQDIFTDICEMKKETLLELRTKPINSCSIPSFDGSELFWDLKRENYGKWNTILVPISVKKNGKLYIGPHQNMLLSKPRILYDDGIGHIGLDKLWNEICEKYKEAFENNPNISFYNIFKRYERFSGEAKEYINHKLKSRLLNPERKLGKKEIKKYSNRSMYNQF